MKGLPLLLLLESEESTILAKYLKALGSGLDISQIGITGQLVFTLSKTAVFNIPIPKQAGYDRFAAIVEKGGIYVQVIAFTIIFSNILLNIFM